MQAEYVNWTDLMLAQVGRKVDCDNSVLFVLSNNSGLSLDGKECEFGQDYEPLGEKMIDIDSLVMIEDEPAGACRFGIFQDPHDNRYCFVDAVFQRVGTLHMGTFRAGNFR
jgi:hypothetical protein